jgi:hypothetical protein
MTAFFAYRFSLAPSLAPFLPEIEYALDFLDRVHGLRRDPSASRVLHYGAEPPIGALAVPAVLFPSGVRVADNGVHPARDALDKLAAGGAAVPLFPKSAARFDGGRLGYDAIGLIALMLTRLEERDSPAADRYGRFPYAASLAARFHAGADPAADLAAQDLAAALTGGTVASATSYEVLATHDVDRLRGYHRPFVPLREAAGDLLKRGKPVAAARRLLRAYGGGEPWHSARRLMARSEAKGVQSRFYFIGPSNAPMDSPYALSMVPLLRRLIDEIRARGHIIGFHPGFGTQADAALWGRQKQGLEHLIGAPVSEGRQHVLGYDAAATPDIWAANGMTLDLTLAFPEMTGFRAGSCRRFKAYSLVQRAPLPLEQASTAVMDFGLFGGKYRSLTLQQALDEAARAADICRRYGGVLVLLHHLGRCDAIVDRFFETVMREVA